MFLVSVLYIRPNIYELISRVSASRCLLFKSWQTRQSVRYNIELPRDVEDIELELGKLIGSVGKLEIGLRKVYRVKRGVFNNPFRSGVVR